MYLSFFGLRQAPFSIAPDPRYLYMSGRHREALAHLLYGVQAGGGFVLLTGEIGAGKTTVCRCFLEQLPIGCQVAYIVNPQLSVGELLQTVAEEFGIAVPDPGGASVKTWVDALNRHLLQAHARGRHCLLIIDEAQHLSAAVLEQLRLLTNLETHERKLLQIVLIGQPELRTLLAAPGMEQLAQRVIARDHLQALNEAETAAYVGHRLAVAGRAGPNPFDARALRLVHARTGGVPRRINLLCDRALLGAYAHGRPQVDARTVEQAAREVFDSTGRARGRRGTAAASSAGAPARSGRPLPGLLVAGIAALGLLALAPWWWPAGGIGPVSTAGAPGRAGSAAGAASALGAAAAVTTASAGSAALPPPPDATAPAAVAPVASLPRFDAAADWAALPADEAQALRELADAWDVALPRGDGCGQAAALGLACWRHRAGSLPLLRQLDRPVVLALGDAAGRKAHVRLVALGADHAVLAAGGRRWQLSTPELAALWRGELLTLWRLPERLDPALAGAAGGLGPGASGPAVLALRRMLERAPPIQSGATGAPAATGAGAAALYDDTLRARVAAFQLAAGLNPDGRTGPTTLMQLMRVLGPDEPRLLQE